MKKKSLSLALALALCLGLTVPAFAAGETTVKDSMGLAYTLSKPALGTKTITADRMLELFGSQDTVTVYLVPEGTVIKPVIKPGTLSNAEARKFTGESEGDRYYLGYEIWDTSGQGSGNLDEEGFELTWSGVQPIISRFDWAIPIIDNPNSPVHNNAEGSDWTSGVIGFEISEEKPAGSEPVTAMPTNDKLTVNGVPADPTVYKIDGSNYFKIRDVAALLNGTEKQFAVGYDGEKKAVTATTGQGYAKLDTDLVGAPAGGNKDASPSNDTIYVNGEKIDVQVYKIDGGNYFKLRDLGKALNFSVDWNKEQGMMIDTGKPYSE